MLTRKYQRTTSNTIYISKLFSYFYYVSMHAYFAMFSSPHNNRTDLRRQFKSGQTKAYFELEIRFNNT